MLPYMRNHIWSVTLLIATALGAMLLISSPAAQECRFKGLLCGKIYLTANSDASLTVANDIPVKDEGSLEPGQKSSNVYYDVDAMKAPEGCQITMVSGLTSVTYPGGEWIKILDTAPWDIRVVSVHC